MITQTIELAKSEKPNYRGRVDVQLHLVTMNGDKEISRTNCRFAISAYAKSMDHVWKQVDTTLGEMGWPVLPDAIKKELAKDAAEHFSKLDRGNDPNSPDNAEKRRVAMEKERADYEAAQAEIAKKKGKK